MGPTLSVPLAAGMGVACGPVVVTVLGIMATQFFLEMLRRKYAEAREEAKKRGDPTYFREAQQKIFDELLQTLPRMTFESPIPKGLRHERNVMVIGDVSVGKSALLNHLFGLNLPMGVGHCTTDIAVAYNDGRLVVWDTFGCNQDFEFYEAKSLAFIKHVGLVVILYSTSLSTTRNIVAVVNKIKGPSGFVCARTKCDACQPCVDRLTIDEEMQRDRDHLAKLGISGARLFKTAACGPDSFENEALKRCMTG